MPNSTGLIIILGHTHEFKKYRGDINSGWRAFVTVTELMECRLVRIAWTKFSSNIMEFQREVKTVFHFGYKTASSFPQNP